MGKQTFGKVTKGLAILLAVLFVVSITAASASACSANKYHDNDKSCDNGSCKSCDKDKSSDEDNYKSCGKDKSCDKDNCKSCDKDKVKHKHKKTHKKHTCSCSD